MGESVFLSVMETRGSMTSLRDLVRRHYCQWEEVSVAEHEVLNRRHVRVALYIWEYTTGKRA